MSATDLMSPSSISTGLGQTLGIFEGTTLALMNQTFAYKDAVFFGDTIRLRLTVESVKAAEARRSNSSRFSSANP